MATVGSLIYNLKARTDDFQKGLKKAQSLASSVSDRIKGSFKGIVFNIDVMDMARTLSSGFKNLVTSASEQIGEINDAANRLGTSTEGLIGFTHAANLAGVSQEALYAALNKMNVAIYNQKDVFSDLGLSARKLAKSGTDEAFLAVADALDKIEGPAKRAAMAQEIFGKGGGKLLNVVDGGSKALREMIEESKALGFSLSRIEVAGVDAMGDKFDTVGKIIDGIKQKITAGLAPTLELVADRMLAISKTPLFHSKLLDLIDMFNRDILTAIVLIEDMDLAWRNFIAGAKQGAKFLMMPGYYAFFGMEPSKEQAKIQGEISDRITNYHKMLDDINKKNKSSRSIGGGVDEATAGIKKLEEAAKKAFGKTMTDSIMNGAKALDRWIDKGIKATEELKKRAKDIKDSIMSPREKMNEQIAEIEKLAKGGFLTNEEKVKAIAKARKDFEDEQKDKSSKNLAMFAPAAEWGSQAAFQTIARSNAGGKPNGIQERQLSEAKKQTGFLKDINSKDGVVITVSGFNRR